jgi:hypothetical protein
MDSMNETVWALQKELCFDDSGAQRQLATVGNGTRRQPSPVPASKAVLSKTNFNYQVLRVKFSLGETVRNGLFAHLKDSNDRLERPLSSGDKLSALQSTSNGSNMRTSFLEEKFKKVWRSCDLIFKALRNAWECPCQEHHVANLRLEHRAAAEISFELILFFMMRSESCNTMPLSRQELQCGQMLECLDPICSPLAAASPSTAPSSITATDGTNNKASVTSRKGKTVAFTTAIPNLPQITLNDMPTTLRLCQQLADASHTPCLGMLDHDLRYHLHPTSKRSTRSGLFPLTLDHMLSPELWRLHNSAPTLHSRLTDCILSGTYELHHMAAHLVDQRR